MAKYFSKDHQNLIELSFPEVGISDKRVIEAFIRVPRHEFVGKDYKGEAYLDMPLPIGESQTISQPSLVAMMTQLLKLKGGERVLEIGTGSGYQAAILSKLAGEVYSVEIIKKLADRAKKTLARLGLGNVHVFYANGTVGLGRYAPYDAIIVTAGGRTIPKPLVDQLEEGGGLVIPVGTSLYDQQLTVGLKQKGKLKLTNIEPVAFVPLTGKYGWKER